MSPAKRALLTSILAGGAMIAVRSGWPAPGLHVEAAVMATTTTSAARTGAAHRAATPRSAVATSMTSMATTSDDDLDPADEEVLATLERLDALTDRADDAALDELLAMETPTHSLARPAFVQLLGHRAGSASAASRDRAVARLVALLTDPDAEDDRITIIEALAETGDPRAARALEQQLGDRMLDDATRLVVVHELAELDVTPAPTARYQELLAQLDSAAALGNEESYEAEIRSDLRLELVRALTR